MKGINPGHSLEERTSKEWFQDAMRAFQDLDVQRAYDLVQCAIRQDPNQADYHLFKARLIETSGSDRRAAISAYEAALNLQPENAEAMLLLAQHFQAEGMQVRAAALVQKARELSPNHKLLKRLEAVPAPIRQEIRKAPDSKDLKDLGQQAKALFNKLLGKVVSVELLESVRIR
jgi:Tfp pilus assembly protein PilF